MFLKAVCMPSSGIPRSIRTRDQIIGFAIHRAKLAFQFPDKIQVVAKNAQPFRVELAIRAKIEIAFMPDDKLIVPHVDTRS